MTETVSDNPRKRAFLAAYVQCATIRGAVAASGVSASSHYNWLQNDQIYVESFAETKEQVCDLLEDEAKRRALDGVRRVRFGKDGEPLIDPTTGEVYCEYSFSDTLLIFLLKGAMPEKYADRQRVSNEVNVAHTIDVTAIVEKLTTTPGYVDYCRNEVCASDTDPGAVCQEVFRTDQRALENGSPQS